MTLSKVRQQDLTCFVRSEPIRSHSLLSEVSASSSGKARGEDQVPRPVDHHMPSCSRISPIPHAKICGQPSRCLFIHFQSFTNSFMNKIWANPSISSPHA